MTATLFPDLDDPAPPPVDGPPLTEVEIAAGVLDDLADRHAPILDWLRTRLVRIYRFRLAAYGPESAFVTADNARRLLHLYPGEVPACKNFLGALFRPKVKPNPWQFTGQRIKSETPGSHGNELRCWRYLGSLDDGGPMGKDLERKGQADAAAK